MDGPVCELVPEQGPALMDFGRCEVMGTDTVIGACGNTGIHRRCDAAFLQWCNDQGGDLASCPEDDALAALDQVPCGTGPNSTLCDLPFKDNCDSLDGHMSCTGAECTTGFCSLPPLIPACSASQTCSNGTVIKCSTDKSTATCSSGTTGAGVVFVECIVIEDDGTTSTSGGTCGP